MKKNKMMRVASALLIAVLLTTSAISGTFAKYVSTGHAEDAARVAKWGIAIKAAGTLFSDAYAAGTVDDSTGTPTTVGNTPVLYDEDKVATLAYTVNSMGSGDTKENVVAPGTRSYSNGLMLGLSGEPEVAVRLTGRVIAQDIFLEKGSWAVMSEPFQFASTDLKEYCELASAGVLYKKESNQYTRVNAPDLEHDTNWHLGDAGENDWWVLCLDSAGSSLPYFPVEYHSYLLSGSATLSAFSFNMMAGLMDDGAMDGEGHNIRESYTEPYALYGGSSDSISTGVDMYRAAFVYSRDDDSDTSIYYPANYQFNRGNGYSDIGLTWEWKYDVDGTTNGLDTILGDLIAKYLDEDDAHYEVVYAAPDTMGADGDVTYYAVTIEKETNWNDAGIPGVVVKCNMNADPVVVANLTTSLYIDLTFTQVD